MKEDLISVIVPIYNVEQFLPKCIETLLSQTYGNIEILLIDDGSTDQSGKISDDYAYKYNNITTYHKPNGGLSDARNYGIEKAKGKYICFVDSDDYVDEKYCEILHTNLVKTKSDISVCNFTRVYEDKGEQKKEYTDEIITVFEDKLEKQKNILNLKNELNTITTVAWNKLYKKELWDNIKYPKGKLNEDEFVIHYLLEESKRIVYSNLKLYYYFQRSDSIMKSTYNEKRLDAVEAFKDRFEYYKKNQDYITLVPITYTRYMKMIISHYLLAKQSGLQHISQQMLMRYREEYKNNKKIYIDNFKDKIQLIIFYYMPQIYSLLKKVRNS